MQMFSWNVPLVAHYVYILHIMDDDGDDLDAYGIDFAYVPSCHSYHP